MILVLTFIHISFSFAALRVLFLGYSKIACVFFSNSYFSLFFFSFVIEHRHVKFILFLLCTFWYFSTWYPITCTLMPYHVSRTYFDNSFLSSEESVRLSLSANHRSYFIIDALSIDRLIYLIKYHDLRTCQNTFCGTHTCRMVCWCT